MLENDLKVVIQKRCLHIIALHQILGKGLYNICSEIESIKVLNPYDFT